MFLNNNIVKTVALLNDNGFRTVDSGDGDTRDFECDRDVGYVVVMLRDDQPLEASADAIHALLKAHGVPVCEDVADAIAPERVMVQANYCPNDRHRLVDVSGIHDSMLTRTP